MILARRDSPGLFASLSSAMGDAGGVPEDVLEVAEMQTIISLVAGGFGVSLVPASVGAVDRSGVAFRPIAGPTPTIELSAAWRRGTGSPVRDAFLELARLARSPSKASAAKPPRATAK